MPPEKNQKSKLSMRRILGSEVGARHFQRQLRLSRRLTSPAYHRSETLRRKAAAKNLGDAATLSLFNRADFLVEGDNDLFYNSEGHFEVFAFFKGTGYPLYLLDSVDPIRSFGRPLKSFSVGHKPQPE